MRDKEKLNEIMTDINVCFHTAALKHVSLCEDSPEDAIKTNVDGINNLIDTFISKDRQNLKLKIVGNGPELNNLENKFKHNKSIRNSVNLYWWIGFIYQ